MTAETDIAAINTGGANTALEVRTALTSVLARADAVPAYPLVIVKTADESVTSSTTLQDDDHLVVPIAANQTLVCRYQLYYDSSTAGGIKFAFTVPAGATGVWSILGMSTSAGNVVEADGRFQSLGDAFTTEMGVGASTTSDHPAIVTAVVFNGGTAGNIVLQWAQESSNGNAARVFKGSHVVVYQG